MNLNRICRIILSFSFCLLIFSSLPAQIRLEALGGVHSSNFIQKNSIPGFENIDGKYFSSSTGFELGVLAEIPFGKNNLFFQPGIIYSAKGNQYERFYDTTLIKPDTLYNQHTLNLNYVEMPLYLTWKISLSKNQKNHFYISAGPYFAFIYGASEDYQNRIKDFNSSKYIYRSGTEDLPVGNGPGKYKTYDIGICAKAGFELGNVLLGAYFSQGLTNAYTATYPSSFHNQVFGGSFGIWLNNPKPAVLPAKDSDKDGTPDTQDSCRTIPGPPRYHGCPIPDSDHDGINDEEDSCKLVPGVARYHGCPVPDSDHDGINDEQDSCKFIPGVEKFHGCPVPDSDHDGVNDEQDSCKLVPGDIRYHGCPIPDSDNDGINDEEDSCKYVAGFADYHGCPIPDRDHDGTNDEMDKCPDQPGPADNQGCPLVKAAIITRAKLVAANIMFHINSTQLTKSSYPPIKELADSLKTNPDLDLLIEGHTDNTGSPAYNLSLSRERAEAVKKVILKLGIADNRIVVRGYGDTRPIADNNTAAGRAENRRVVFVFQLKNR